MSYFDSVTTSPTLEFSLFTSNETSGLTLEEINDVVANQTETSENSERNIRLIIICSKNVSIPYLKAQRSETNGLLTNVRRGPNSVYSYLETVLTTHSL